MPLLFLQVSLMAVIEEAKLRINSGRPNARAITVSTTAEGSTETETESESSEEPTSEIAAVNGTEGKSEESDASVAVSAAAAFPLPPSAVASRPVLSFTHTSQVQLVPQKDIQGPWTVEFWLYRNSFQPSLSSSPSSSPSPSPPPSKQTSSLRTESNRATSAAAASTAPDNTFKLRFTSNVEAGHRVRRRNSLGSDVVGLLLHDPNPNLSATSFRFTKIEGDWAKLSPLEFVYLQNSDSFREHDPAVEGWCLMRSGSQVFLEVMDDGHSGNPTLPVEYLLASSSGYIKLQTGGRYMGDVDDHLQREDFVNDQAM